MDTELRSINHSPVKISEALLTLHKATVRIIFTTTTTTAASTARDDVSYNVVSITRHADSPSLVQHNSRIDNRWKELRLEGLVH